MKRLRYTLKGNADIVTCVIYDSSAEVVISGSEDNTLRVWRKGHDDMYVSTIIKSYTSAVTCFDWHLLSRQLFIGLENGCVMCYEMNDDLTQTKDLREMKPHIRGVTGVVWDSTHEVSLSIGRDSKLQIYSTKTGVQRGVYSFNAWCSAIVYNESSRHVFVGDYSGKIHFLKVHDDGLSALSVLEGHEGSIRSLHWDSHSQSLFSGSFDNVALVWRIGEGKGTLYELRAHTGKINAIAMRHDTKELLTAGDDGMIIAWDMTADRTSVPEWKESDICEICDTPFFWNHKIKFNTTRQHHCRMCGAAICSTDCRNTCIPLMGFENPVKVCKTCFCTITSDMLKSCKRQFKAVTGTKNMHWNQEKVILTTADKDNIIRMWQF